LLPVVLACTVRDHGTASDPAMVFHRYTLLQVSGPLVLIYVGAPALMSVVLAVLLRQKTRVTVGVWITRRGALPYSPVCFASSRAPVAARLKLSRCLPTNELPPAATMSRPPGSQAQGGGTWHTASWSSHAHRGCGCFST